MYATNNVANLSLMTIFIDNFNESSFGFCFQVKSVYISGIRNLFKTVPKLAKEMNKANLLNTYKTK